MKSKSDKNLFIITCFASIMLFIFSMISPLIFTRSLTDFDFTNTGQIGDTIGGLMSPFIAMVATILTFAAFYVQYRANQIQIRNFENQENQVKLERFETKLFNMLDIHRKNVSDLEISFKKTETRYFGQNFFPHVINFFNGLYSVFSKYKELSEKEKTILSYLYMFYGFSLEMNENLKNHYNSYFDNKIKLGTGLIKYNNALIADESIYDYGFGQLLSRYFRYQFQIIKYIDEFEIPGYIMSLEEKKIFRYEHSKHLRSHLTNNEQILLYYNCLTPLGKIWNDNNYIKDYKLIKNIIIPQVEGYSPITWAEIDLKLNKDEIKDLFEFIH
ncbi:MAG: hypothetical protein CVV49_16705 [Spirochaetae bacterium HGW-Spirochaetae-5]|jgi:hypothetical protein|nr:MAG: hypothetical protein CVV49_16705 [Spirochaetae bacterium HGW-Spirochaetae-5]